MVVTVVLLCHNCGAQNAHRKVPFHSFPDVDTEKGKQWIS